MVSKHDQHEVHKNACSSTELVVQCLWLNKSRSAAHLLASRKKRVQFATLFQLLLACGRLMTEFEAIFEQYEFLNVLELPCKHWVDSFGWVMVEHLYDFVNQRIKTLVSSAAYLAFFADETSACDNTSWIAIHTYVMLNWCHVRASSSVNLENGCRWCHYQQTNHRCHKSFECRG